MLQGPLTSMSGSVCHLTGESLRGFDLAGLLVEGLDGPKENSLGGLEDRAVADGRPFVPLFVPGLCSGLPSSTPLPFC